jgi:hypothetical protein
MARSHRQNLGHQVIPGASLSQPGPVFVATAGSGAHPEGSVRPLTATEARGVGGDRCHGDRRADQAVWKRPWHRGTHDVGRPVTGFA